MSRFVVIGAGECGARAAHALREKGFEGEVTLIGAEAHHPYERPPLSKAGLQAGASPKFIAEIASYASSRIDLRLAVEATGIDIESKTVALSNGTTLGYDKLLLATGASARPYPGISAGSSRIRLLRTHNDAVALQGFMLSGRHVAIVGAGFIGLELAATARAAGARVTVAEGQDRVLKRGVPEEIASVISERHISEGVDLRCGVAIDKLGEVEDGAHLKLTTGEVVEADVVLVGIGALPNTALAHDAGLAIDNGIAVDDELRTSSPDIYAAGDCCSFPLEVYGGRRTRLESWRNAQDQGNLAATNMMGGHERVSSVPWFWSDQYDLTLQIAGLAQDAVTQVRRDLGPGAFILFHLDASGHLVAASGIGPGNSVARDIRLAEMLIAKRAMPSASDLSDNSVKLKSLLAA